ncbi:MAG TPA: polysaccharide biosynthesis tyrosine autokinase, partial [Paludibacter sp.]|nr:polysaccharide biosynthesis tyrosine autokinase [Paludibacter sp.]
MNKYSEFEKEFEEEGKQIDFVGVFFYYLSYWKWFVVSLFVCIAISLVYLRFALPGYEASTSILLKDDQKGGGALEMNAFKEMGLLTQKNNVDNELEVLNKSILAEQVVRELGLYVNYTQIGRFQFVPNYFSDFGKYKEKVLYGSECPILVRLPDELLTEMHNIIEFEILVHSYGVYEFSGSFRGKKYNVKASISDNHVMLPFGRLNILRGKFRPSQDMIVNVVIQSPMSKADEIMGQLKMELASKTTSVVNLTFNSNSVNLGKDFLSKLIEVYNREDMNERTKMTNKTAQFIDDRLMLLTRELGDVESKVENYKQVEGITDIKSQSDMFIQQTNDFVRRRLELETQLAIVSDLNNYIQKKENRYQLIPSSSGITSSGLSELINNYNRLLLQKNRFSRIASSSNQAMIDLTSQIESMSSTVQSSVQNERDNLKIALRDLLNKNSENASHIRAIPRQERQYSEIKRQQGIKEALYLFLLQKKEERYMDLSVVEPVSKLIDNVRSSASPVSPMKNLILLFALFIGLIIPVLGIKIRDLLRYQIGCKEELEDISKVPVLGEIPKANQTGNVIIKENNTDSFTELVRLLRTNLLFVMDSTDKKIINILSSISGEGKTFVTINLAISLALLDKKVLIIELDIRKPKLAKYLEIDNETGITLYLTGHLDKDKLIQASGIHSNLSVIMAGPIPPNPNELLAKPSLDKLIAELRDKYDYIVIDTSPIG